MYIAKENKSSDTVIRAIDLVINKNLAHIDTSNLICPDCKGKVSFRNGKQRQPHFSHARNTKKGDCIGNRSYKNYHKQTPDSIFDAIKKAKYLELFLQSHEKPRKRKRKSNGGSVTGEHPGKTKKDIKSKNGSIKFYNKYSTNLTDILSFLASNRYSESKNDLDKTWIIFNDKWERFRDVVIKIEDVDWGHDSARYHQKSAVYWGRISSCSCFQNGVGKCSLKDIDCERAVEYKLVVNFGNKQSHKPTVKLSPSVTKDFLSKYHKTGKNDVKGLLAVIPESMARKHEGINFFLNVQANVSMERRSASRLASH
ncbi:MAG: competence protein CoiA family protein [Gammaproteobacteria bacterium]